MRHLLLLLSVASVVAKEAHSYGGKGHVMVTQGIIHCLRVNGYHDLARDLILDRSDDFEKAGITTSFVFDGENVNLKSYLDILAYGYPNSGVLGKGGAASPDIESYPDPDFESRFLDVVRGFYETFFTVNQIQEPFPFEDFENKLKRFARGSVDDPASAMVAGMQHTYSVDLKTTIDNPFSQFSVADAFAQKEYDEAVRIFREEGNAPKSFAQLGRVLHYAQDVTVPHHAKAFQNIYDVHLAYKAGGAMSATSQDKYESAYIDGAISIANDTYEGWQIFHEDPVGKARPIWDEFLLFPYYDHLFLVWAYRSIKRPPSAKIRQPAFVENIVQKNAYIAAEQFDYCDGECANELQTNNLYVLGPVLKTKSYGYCPSPWDCDMISNPTIDCAPHVMALVNWKDTIIPPPPRLDHKIGTVYTIRVGRGEDYHRTAGTLIPLAVLACSKIVVEFCRANPSAVAINPRITPSEWIAR